MHRNRDAGSVQLPDNMNGSNVRMKNNLVQRQYDLYATSVNRQVKALVEGRNERFHVIYKDKIKKIK